MTEYLAIGDVTVRMRAEGERTRPVLEGVARYLHTVGRRADGQADLSIDLVTEAGSSGPSPDAHRLGTFDNGFTLWRDEGAVLLVGSGCVAHLDVAAGRGIVRIALDTHDAASRWIACAVVLESLTMLLHRHGLFSMHAAALARGERGLVVAAAADSGKSTLTFRLVQSGWHYLSDDTILVRPSPDGVTVRGLRAHFSLDPEAEELFPGLSAGREASLLKEEKWAVNVEALYPEQRLDACRPAVLLFPTIVDVSESRITPVSNAEAIGALLAQSSLARVKLDYAAAHVDALGRLVRDTRAYVLHAGRDLLDDPTRADALIAPLLSTTF